MKSKPSPAISKSPRLRVGLKDVSREEFSAALNAQLGKQRVSIMLDGAIVAFFKAKAGELVAQVFKTLNAQHIGKQSFVRIWSGELAENATLKDQVAAAAGADGELVKTLQKQVTDLTAKLTAAEAAAAKAQADLAKAQADLTKAQADLAKSQADLAKAQADLDAALKEVATLRAQIGGIQQSVTPMPSYVGQQQVAVEDFAKAKKLQLVIEKVTTSSSPAAVGTVLAQQPKAGIPLVEGSAIWIQVYAPK